MISKEGISDIFSIASRLGVKNIELLYQKDDTLRIRVFKGETDHFSSASSSGIGFRVIYKGCNGYAFTENLDKDSIEKTIKNAFENAKVTVEKDGKAKLYDFEDSGELPFIYNNELDKVSIDDKINMIVEMEDYAYAFDKKIINVEKTVYSQGKYYLKIANSMGMDKEYEGNYCGTYISPIACKDDRTKTGLEYYIGRDFSEINNKFIAEKAAQRAVRLLDGQKVTAGKYTLLFENIIFADLMGTFSGLFSGKNIQENKSILKGKIGEIIANEEINIIDNAFYEQGLAARKFDAEGVPSQINNLVSNGRLMMFLQNTETGLKDGVESTGNASRGYQSTLSVTPSNLYIPNGRFSESELLSSKEKVIKIIDIQGLHAGANPISGDFSLMASGFLYEDGEYVTALDNFIISGNFVETLKNTIGIGDNLRFGFPGGNSNFGSPSMLVKDIAVAG